MFLLCGGLEGSSPPTNTCNTCIYLCSLPAAVKKVLHPIITCALTANLGVFALGVTTGKGFEATLSECSLHQIL